LLRIRVQPGKRIAAKQMDLMTDSPSTGITMQGEYPMLERAGGDRPRATAVLVQRFATIIQWVDVETIQVSGG
jgi:hypothetical protein